MIFIVGFIYGYDIGVISGALSHLEERFDLSSIEAGLVVACLPLGSMFGCVLGGPFCDRYGRLLIYIVISKHLAYMIDGKLSCSRISSMSLAPSRLQEHPRFMPYMPADSL